MPRNYMLVFAAIWPFSGMEMTGMIAVLRAGGDGKMGLICDIFSMWMFTIPLAAACAFVFRLSPYLVVSIIKFNIAIEAFVGIWENSYKKMDAKSYKMMYNGSMNKKAENQRRKLCIFKRISESGPAHGLIKIIKIFNQEEGGLQSELKRGSSRSSIIRRQWSFPWLPAEAAETRRQQRHPRPKRPPEEAAKETEAEKKDDAKETEAVKGGEEINKRIAYVVGNLGDKSFNDSGESGNERFKRKGLKGLHRPSRLATRSKADEWEDMILDVIDEGYYYIVASLHLH